MKRKKLGNSLIVVVIMCMVVTTVSAATLTMVAGNYKARVVESKRVENLYSSDSGLDVAYNIIGKTFDSAINYGYGSVELLKINEGNSPDRSAYNTLKNDIIAQQAIIDASQNQNIMTDAVKNSMKRIEEDNKQINELINREFRRTFNEFITGNYQEGDPQPQTTETDKAKRLVDYIKYSSYKSVNYNKDTRRISFATINVNFTGSSKPTLWVPVDGEDNPDGISFNGFREPDDNGKYKIVVKSRFRIENENEAAIGENSRIVQATYFIKIPNYEDIFSKQESGDLHEYLALNNRALTIGGDMNIDNINSLNVNGNIFVQGVEPTIINNDGTPPSNRTYEKYHGGITLSRSTNVNFNNDVITRNTFNIRNDANVTIDGNLYGRNVYMGGQHYNNPNEGLDEVATNSTLNAKNKVVLDNDLALKATDHSSIIIRDFYGINDKNIFYDDLKGNIDPLVTGDKVKSSSSIIVNGSDNTTSINIDNSAYIMGTAHINTTGNNEGYQTGESGAVKGNYVAYSVPLEEVNNQPEKFDYYDPLQLLNDSNVFNKATHFASYWNGKEASTGGIHWPKDRDGNIDLSKIHSIGAIVYQEDKKGDEQQPKPRVMIPNYLPALELGPNGEVYKARIDFAKNAYKFGQGDSSISDYDNPNPITFNSLMTLSATTIGTDYKFNNEMSIEKEKAVFNWDPQNIIVIKGSHSSASDYTGNSYKVIDATNNKEINAVIATTGDVIIDGDVTLNGGLIANGNLTITGGNDASGVSINYNKDLIDRIQQKNNNIHNLFFRVFGNGMIDEIEDTSISTIQTNTNVSYDLKNFLESQWWKIIN